MGVIDLFTHRVSFPGAAAGNYGWDAAILHSYARHAML